MNNTGIYNANTHNTDQNIYNRQNFKQYHTNKPNICGISDDKTDCSRQNAFCDRQTMRIYHSDVYVKELKLETVLTKIAKIYNIKHSHQPI